MFLLGNSDKPKLLLSLAYHSISNSAYDFLDSKIGKLFNGFTLVLKFFLCIRFAFFIMLHIMITPFLNEEKSAQNTILK